MIRFQSKAGADVLMLDRHAQAVLGALGREPAAQGIFLPEQIEAALQAFATRPAEPARASVDDEEELDERDIPDLARRAWPVLELLRRALAEQHPVLWMPAS